MRAWRFPTVRLGSITSRDPLEHILGMGGSHSPLLTQRIWNQGSMGELSVLEKVVMTCLYSSTVPVTVWLKPYAKTEIERGTA